MINGKSLCIDLYCGLGGWAEGFLAEGWDIIGFDIERHDYGTGGYPGQLVLQDVTTLHGSQLKDAACVVASPPCQAYSYRAMPWKRAKALPPPDNTLFEACFRIQREAIEATVCPTCNGTGVKDILKVNTWDIRSELCRDCSPLRTGCRHIPLIVENVRGAQPWVGQAKWNFGSYYLCGDVPALMPTTFKGFKSTGMNWSDPSKRGQDFTRVAGRQARESKSFEHIKDAQVKIDSVGIKGGGDWFGSGPNCSLMRRFSGTKQAGISGPRSNGKGDRWFQDGAAKHGSKSNSRKAASAMIAKIPFPLAQHIARVFRPVDSFVVDSTAVLHEAEVTA